MALVDPPWRRAAPQRESVAGADHLAADSSRDDRAEYGERPPEGEGSGVGGDVVRVAACGPTIGYRRCADRAGPMMVAAGRATAGSSPRISQAARPWRCHKAAVHAQRAASSRSSRCLYWRSSRGERSDISRQVTGWERRSSGGIPSDQPRHPHNQTVAGSSPDWPKFHATHTFWTPLYGARCS